ncbi:MAG: serine hydrolase [Myxococcota bacterium]
MRYSLLVGWTLALTTVACRPTAETTETPVDTGPAPAPEVTVAEPTAIDEQLRARAEMAAEYSASVTGHGVLIMVDGQVVFEGAQNDWASDRPHKLASGTKSFWSSVVAAAIEDGIVSGFDEKAAETLGDWATTDARKAITVRQLLNFTSGIDPDLGIEIQQVAETDVFALALSKDNVNDPGTRWAYSGTSHTVLGALLERKLAARDTTLEAYLRSRILEPLGMELQDWRRDAEGRLLMPTGARFLPQEWAAYGEMVRLGGVTADGTRVLPEGAVAQMFEPSSAPPAGQFYALGWWLDSVDTYRAKLPRDLVLAGGSGGQMLAIIPSQKITAVRFGDSDDFNEAEFLCRLLYGVDLKTRLAEGASEQSGE